MGGLTANGSLAGDAIPGNQEDEGPHGTARKDANDQKEPASCLVDYKGVLGLLHEARATRRSRAHQLTFRLHTCAMHMMTPMKMAQARTPTRETHTRRLPSACAAMTLFSCTP